MKNLLKKSLLVLMMLVMVPLSAFLVACGATPSEEAKGVTFVSNKYDEETGKAIFEVDLLVATELTYKCNPSSTTAKPRFTIPVEGQTNSQNRSRFTFEKGVITVNYPEFEQIEIKVEVAGFTDQCIVRLKQYPIKLTALESEVVLNAGSSYTICPVGEFENGEVKNLSEEGYNFSVVSDNETVITVSKEDRLTVYSSRQSAATANVTVTMNDSTGKATGLSFKVKFIVVEPAEEGFLIFDNFGKFVNNGDTLVLDANALEPNEDGEYELHYNAYFVSSIGTYVQNTGNFTGLSDSQLFVSFDDENQLIKIKSDKDRVIQITIWTDLVKDDGSALKITFEIDFTAKV